MNSKNSCPDTILMPSCFSLLTREEWETISSGQQFTTFRKGELMLKQGVFSNYVLFITEGYTLKFIESEAGRPVNINISQAGDFIGLQSVLGEAHFNYSYRALSDVKACMINLAVLKSLLEINQSFALRLLRRTLEDENTLIRLSGELAYKQMNGRMAATLLFLTEDKRADINVFSLLSRKDLADFAGISPINVVKILKDFEKEGLIRLRDRDIYLCEREALETIAMRG